jgi:hypothetical protein
MSVKSGQAITVLFSTANASTGAAADASSTPTGTLYVNGTANGATVTVTNITTGLYKAALTLPSLTAGDVVSLRVTATVATVAGEGVVWQDVADTVRLSDVPAVNVTQQGGVAVAAADANGNVSANIRAVKSSLAAADGLEALSVWYDAETYVAVSRQEVRDAMMLAPTAGVPAADGSVDALLGDGLEALKASLLAGLSGASVTVVSAVSGGTVTVHAADTWRFTVASEALEALGLADYEVLGLVVKRDARQTDNQALLYVRSDTGLVRMDGAAPVSAGNGTLTKAATSFTAVVHVAETQGLVPGVYTWWLKGLDTTPAPDEAVTLATGEFVVLAAGLQAVV